MHEDDELGANLADLWIDNRSTTWSAEEVAEFCDDLVNTVGEDDLLWSPHTWYDPDTQESLSKRGEGNYRELEVFYPDKFHT